METPLVVIDFRNKSIYTVTDPPREPEIAQALRDSHPSQRRRQSQRSRRALQIRWAVLCRYVEVHDGMGTIVGAGIDTIYVHELPTDVVVNVAVRPVGHPEEFAHFELEARVSGPNLDTVLEHTYPPVLLGISTGDPGIDAGWTLPIALAFPAEAEGVYTITLDVGGGVATSSLLVGLIQNPPGGE